ncbi:MAG TPA: hypothetical protein VMY87_11995 [Armatimonadota bacterium]|nr:hypothetical protein [Armatimonadota bacterium]
MWRLRGPSRCFRGWLVCLAGVLVVGIGPAAAAQDSAPTFRFDPPDGTRYVESVDTTQVLDFGEGRTSARRSELRTEVAMEKEATGYRITSTLVSGGTTSALEEADNAALKALEGVPLTYSIDGEARIASVSGIRQATDKVRAALPATIAAIVSKALTEEAVLATAQADWDRRVLNFVGRPAGVGEVWVAREKFPVPSGEVVGFYSAMRVAKQEQVGGRDCVRVEYSYSRDPRALRDFLGDAGEAALAGRERFPGSSEVSGKGYRLLDPATLLCYGEELEREVKTTLTTPEGESFPVTIRQTKSYRYEYEGGR